ncbi:phage tail protein, partial [Citrobacter freundii]
MFHVDNNSAVPVMPAVKPVVSAVTSFFTEGGNGVPPTYPGPDWFNIIQSELLAVLAAAGITPDKASNVQLLAAMRALFLDTSQNGADIQDKALFLQNIGIIDGLDFTGDISAPNMRCDTTVTVGDGTGGIVKGGVDGAG